MVRVRSSFRLAGLLAAWVVLLAGVAHAAEPLSEADEAKVAEVRTAASKDHLERCYALAKDVRLERPGSALESAVFEYAAYCQRLLWLRKRVIEPDSPYVNEEARFMFEWLASYLDTDTFPRERLETYFVGFRFKVFPAFDTHVGQRPEVAQWELQVVTDNGEIHTVVNGDGHPAGRTPDGKLPRERRWAADQRAKVAEASETGEVATAP